MTLEPIVALDGVTVRYAGADRVALDAVDLAIASRERIGITGDNGSGKTTLLHALTALCPIASGTLRHRGEPVTTEAERHALRREVGVVFQHADDQLFSPTVIEDVAFGPLNLGWGSAKATERSHALLERLGIGALADAVTHTLSGGQKRMVALATVLVMEPAVLLLDEPTNDLDAASRARLIRLLKERETAVLVVSHDNALLDALELDRRLALEAGRLATGEDA